MTGIFHRKSSRHFEDRIMQVANLSHPVNVSISRQSIDVSFQSMTLDRDIILDVDLPNNRPFTTVTMEASGDPSKNAILFAIHPRPSDFGKISSGTEASNTEFIFIGMLSDHSSN